MRNVFALAVALLPVLCSAGAAREPAQSTVLSVSQHFYAPASDADDKPARHQRHRLRDCRRPDGARECVVANDEEAAPRTREA